VPVYRKIPEPVIPKTMLELQLEEESARYMEKFWTDILIGDALLVQVTRLQLFLAVLVLAGGWDS